MQKFNKAVAAVARFLIPYLLCCYAQVSLGQANNTGNLYIAGNVYINGSFTNGATANLLNNGTVYLGGDFTNNQAGVAAGGATSMGTYIFRGNSLQNINGTQPSNFYGLTLNNASNVLLGANISVAGIFTPTVGALRLNGNTLSLSGTIDNTVGNTGTITADANGTGTSSISITGSGNLGGNLSFTPGGQTLQNFTLNRASGVVTLGSSLNIGGTTALTNNGVAAFTAGALAINGNTLGLNGTVGGTGTITGSASSSLTIGGNLSSQLGTLYFTPGAQQLNNITINRASGGSIGNAVLGSSLTASSITLTYGVIATGNNLFTWDHTGTLTAPNKPYVAHTAAYNNSFIATCDASGTGITPSVPYTGNVGFRINNVGGSVETYFPVGLSFLGPGPGLAPTPNRMMLNNTGTTDNFTVLVGYGDVRGTPSPIVERIWYVNAAGGTGIKANMRLFFTKRDWTNYPTAETEVESGFDYSSVALAQKDYSDNVINLSNASSDILSYLGSYTNNADEIYGQYTIGTSTSYDGLSNGITYFNRFTVLNAPGLVLAEKNIRLSGVLAGNGVALLWKSINEQQTTHYLLERAPNGTNFTALANIAAQGNNLPTNTYSYVDDLPLQPIGYYRVTGFDVNGIATYSNTITVANNSVGNASALVYPNPITNSIVTVKLQNVPAGSYNVCFFNMAGQKTYEKVVTHPGNAATYHVSLPAGISKGVYTMVIKGQQFSCVKAVLVQ